MSILQEMDDAVKHFGAGFISGVCNFIAGIIPAARVQKKSKGRDKRRDRQEKEALTLLDHPSDAWLELPEKGKEKRDKNGGRK